MSVKLIERQLHRAQRGLESWRFLVTVASALLVSTTLFLPSLDFEFNSRDFFAAFMIDSAICLVLALIWMRWVLPAVIAFAAATTLLIAMPLYILVMTIYVPERSPLLLLVVIVVLYFPAAIVRAGLPIAFASVPDRALTAPNRGITTFLFHVFGIHPICRWLPSKSRRIVSIVVFVISRIILGLAITFLCVKVWSYYFFRSNHAQVAAACELNKWSGDCIVAAANFLFFPLLLVLVTFALAAGMRFIARRLARSSMERLISQDQRPPILFLRSFSDDQVRLAPPRRSALRWLILRGDPRPLLDHILLEEMTPHGPVVAIGAPRTRPPFGIARTYVSDDDWKMVVEKLSATARLIVIAADETPGVRWEMEHVSSETLTRKTLFILPPRYSDSRSAGRIILQLVSTSLDDGEGAGVAASFFDECRSACVGWFVRPDGMIEVLTADAPSDTAYILALRVFTQHQGLVEK